MSVLSKLKEVAGKIGCFFLGHKFNPRTRVTHYVGDYSVTRITCARCGKIKRSYSEPRLTGGGGRKGANHA